MTHVYFTFFARLKNENGDCFAKTIIIGFGMSNALHSHIWFISKIKLKLKLLFFLWSSERWCNRQFLKKQQSWSPRNCNQSACQISLFFPEFISGTAIELGKLIFDQKKKNKKKTSICHLVLLGREWALSVRRGGDHIRLLFIWHSIQITHLRHFTSLRNWLFCVF